MTTDTIAPAGGVSDLLSNGGPPPAAPVAPAWQPAPPVAFSAPEAAAARAEIETLKADKSFYKRLVVDKEPAANQKWAELHSKGWPTVPGVSSQNDVNAQVEARRAEQWNGFFAALGWSPTPEQQAEMKAGVVREDIHKIALERRDAMIKDKVFYRRYLDGDRAAKEEWGKVIAVVGLRPVPATYFTKAR
jgi:hypothetical protein